MDMPLRGIPILGYSYGPKREFIKYHLIKFITILVGFSVSIFFGVDEGIATPGRDRDGNVRRQDHLAIRQRAEKMKAMKADRQ